MKRRAKALPSRSTASQTFLAHLHELRRRLYYVVASVIVGGGLAYAVEHHVLEALLKPAKGQQFIYTSPMGGMNFLFNVCIYIGLIVSIPMIIFQVLKYIEPMMPKHSSKFIFKVSAASAVLAVVGIIFGYFVGLPNTLDFLLNQFINQQVKPLVTIQSYMSFVGMYMLSSALLLQAPLILLLINHIKPQKPKNLLKHERWVILLSFTGAFIMNPTPNVVAQSMVAVPIIVSYHVGIVMIYFVNRKPRRPAKVRTLIERDAALQAERMARVPRLQPLTIAAPLASVKVNAVKQMPASKPKPAPAQSIQKVYRASPVQPRPPTRRYRYDSPVARQSTAPTMARAV